MSQKAFLRLATIDDAQYLLDIYSPYVQSTMISFEYEVPSLSEFEHRITSKTKHFPWIVCEIDGAVAGYSYASYFREREAYKWDAELSVYVTEEYHGRRIATALYQSLIDLLKMQGFCNVYGGVTSPNIGSQHLHESFGFETVGVFKNTGNKFGQWADVTFYAMSINPYENDPVEPISVGALDEDKVEDLLDRCTRLIRNHAAQADLSQLEDSSDTLTRENE